MKISIQIIVFFLFYLIRSKGLIGLPLVDNVSFYCYNRTGKNVYPVFPSDTQLESKILLYRHSIFIVHGWINSFHDSPWMLELMVHCVNYIPDTNVCAISWGNLAKENYITAATTHVYSVAEHIAKTFNGWRLIPEKITMVGHSLGAQISGHVGFLFSGALKAIFGLDPAHPFFCDGPAPSNKRLDPSDAQYVQTIISCKGFLGCDKHIGHMTFYPDGGTHPQPFCGYIDANCSHQMSVEYFKFSVNPTILYKAKKCDNFDMFKDGACDSNLQTNMGYYADRTPEFWGEYYLDVTATEPFVA